MSELFMRHGIFLFLIIVLIFFAFYFSSPLPDGLEYTAKKLGFAERAKTHPALITILRSE